MPIPENRKAQCLLLIAIASVEVARRWKNAIREICAVRIVTDFEQAQREINEYKPSVVLLDISLPPVDGVERFASLLKLSSASKFIVFSENPSENEAVQALRAGASGYAHRDLDPILLKKAVEVVRKGEMWISRNTIPHLVKELNVTKKEDLVPRLDSRRRQFSLQRPVELNRLTSREKEIAYFIGNGSRNKEIASLLKISESTVKAHLSAIYNKLGLMDRLSLALFVVQQVRSGTQNQPVSRE